MSEAAIALPLVGATPREALRPKALRRRSLQRHASRNRHVNQWRCFLPQPDFGCPHRP